MTGDQERVTSTSAEIGEALLVDGFARLALGPAQVALIDRLLIEAREFFASSVSTKMRNASTDLNFGYRPFGYEYSQVPERPDLNECFAVWSDRADLIPGHGDITGLLDAALAWREELGAVVDGVLRWLATKFGAPDRVPFRNASYLQLNNYSVRSVDREFLQEKHEDGHLVTLGCTTGPGLEILPHGHVLEVGSRAEELIVMPGSILTELTGGRIAALEHQVRNLRADGRVSVMYFVNPELDDPLYAWVEDPGTAPADVRDQVRDRPTAFGLPRTPYL